MLLRVALLYHLQHLVSSVSFCPWVEGRGQDTRVPTVWGTRPGNSAELPSVTYREVFLPPL